MTLAMPGMDAQVSLLRLAARGRVVPFLTVGAMILVIWYMAAFRMNLPQINLGGGVQPGAGLAELMEAAYSMERPILPTPVQILEEFWRTTAGQSITSKRSLFYHAWVTISAAGLGFLFGVVLGIALAIGIVRVRTLDRSLMPWIIASQTVPILAIAPMIIVVLGNQGITGLLPKSLISMYLCFFPVTIGMVKGLRSPDPLQLDLMRTYNASTVHIFQKLRWPASLPFLFASLKVAIAISLVGAIVGELPTGATAGLGARLLTGSYYGQTIQIWSALLMASLLGVILVQCIGAMESLTMRRLGRRPAR